MTNYLTVTPETRFARDGTIKLHGPDGFVGMRRAGRIAAEVLEGVLQKITSSMKCSMRSRRSSCPA